jgi:toxin ParE1/3/4
MAPAAVRFHPAAAQEAESAYDWYAARNSSAADGFREELRQAIDAVATSPRTWPRYGSRARRYVFPRYPFSLVYILRGDRIEGRCRGSRSAPTWQLAVASLTRPLTSECSGRRYAPPLIRPFAESDKRFHGALD